MNQKNKEYANLLEKYADVIRQSDYEISREQREMIRKLGETLLDRTDEVIRRERKRSLERSSFKLISKLDKEDSKRALERSSIKLARDIEYRERTRRIKNICKRSRKKSVK